MNNIFISNETAQHPYRVYQGDCVEKSECYFGADRKKIFQSLRESKIIVHLHCNNQQFV